MLNGARLGGSEGGVLRGWVRCAGRVRNRIGPSMTLYVLSMYCLSSSSGVILYQSINQSINQSLLSDAFLFCLALSR